MYVTSRCNACCSGGEVAAPPSCAATPYNKCELAIRASVARGPELQKEERLRDEHPNARPASEGKEAVSPVGSQRCKINYMWTDETAGAHAL